MNGVRPQALVTGASAGLGAAFARAYAARGSDLILTARREARLTALAHELESRYGARSTVLPCDLGRPGAAGALFREVDARGLTVDVLVNNAGYGVPGSYRGRPWQVHAEFQQVMIEAVAELCYLVIPGMRARGAGTILNVASLAGHMPGTAGHTLYGPAKAWLIKFSECLHDELFDDGITVCALCPGFTYTEFHDVLGVRENMNKLPKYMWQQARPVCVAGLDGVERNKPIVVPGAFNKTAAALCRVLPYSLTSKLIPKGVMER